MDCSLPGSSVRGIFQARVLEWGAIAFSNLVKIPLFPKLIFRFYTVPIRIPADVFVEIDVCVHSQSCPALCNPMDCNLPGSSVHGILQARILEWGAMPSFRGSLGPRNQACFSCTGRRALYHPPHLGSAT